jgi:hypothetical protein
MFPISRNSSGKDGEALAQRCLSILMTDQVTFQDIWNNRLAFMLVPLEEACFNHWTWGRFACRSDSIHKVSTSNEVPRRLYRLMVTSGPLTLDKAATMQSKVLLHWLMFCTSLRPRNWSQPRLQSFHRHREARVKATFTISNLVTRLEALNGPVERIVVLHVLPNPGDWLPNQIANNSIGSERLNFLSDPERSFHGMMAFNQNYGIGHEPSMLTRVLIGLPFLATAYLFRTMFTTIVSRPAFTTQLMGILRTNQIDFDSGQSWDIPRLPEYLRLLVPCELRGPC